MGDLISPPSLQQALRLSLHVTAWTSQEDAFSLVADNPSRSDDDDIKDIIQRVLWSSKFVLTYHFVIVGTLCCVTGIHWFFKLHRRYHRRKTRAFVSHSPSNLRNGTVEDLAFYGGLDATDATDASERLPLLKAHRLSRQHIHQMSGLSYIRAWLMYQPPPIPIINKVLPSNGMSIAILAFIGLNLFYLFYRIKFSARLVVVLADRAAILFVANLPLLYLLSAKNQPIKYLTGYSYEGLNIFHRRLGEIMFLLALIHTIGMFGVWYTLLRPEGFSLERFIFEKVILLGLGAFITYETIYLTSLGSLRQRWYELFLALHVILQVAALTFLFFHHHGSRLYVILALVIYFIDRFAMRMTKKMKSLRATLEVKDDGETVKLTVPFSEKSSVKKDIARIKLPLMDITGGWQPAEHVFLTVPSLSWKHVIQAHPFTIATQVPNPRDSDVGLELLIRAQDGFSKDLLTFAKSHNSVQVWLDGPYGSQSLIDILGTSDLAIFVAGGSGISVTWPLLGAFLESRADDVEGERATLHRKKALFVWIVNKKSHLSWMEKDALHAMQDRGVEIVIPEPTSEKGRPAIPELITSWIQKTEHEILGAPAELAVVGCGPESMNRSVRNTCSSLTSHGHNITVGIEKYGW